MMEQKLHLKTRLPHLLGKVYQKLGWLRSWYVISEAKWQVSVILPSDFPKYMAELGRIESCVPSMLSAGMEPQERGCDFAEQKGLCLRAEAGPPVTRCYLSYLRRSFCVSCPLYIEEVISGVFLSPAHSSHLFPATHPQATPLMEN